MPDNAIHVLGFRVFASETLVHGWLIFWIPITLLAIPVIRKCLATFVFDPQRRRRWLIGCIAAFLSTPWWGVIPLSIKANKACRDHTGIRVYKTIDVEEFPTHKGIKWAAAHGFKYAVSPIAQLEFPDTLWRETFVNGVVVRERIAAPANVVDSRREYLRLDSRMLVNIDAVVDLRNNMRLAEARWITGKYTLFNRIFTLGAFSEGWSCGSDFKPSDKLMLAVLRPKKQR